MDGLRREWELRLPLLKGQRIRSVYLGGGTPFLLGADRVGALLSMIRQQGLLCPDAEITIEANPENIEAHTLAAMMEHGVNRISMGVQSFDDRLLKNIGRTHGAKQARDAVERIASTGITNISIDLMYDLPTQTLEHWKQSLAIASALPITHLSLYNLTLEPHTVFYKQRESIQRAMPDEETSTAMYAEAIETLEASGLLQYEISAFARPGYRSEHNSGYWLARPFLGLGPSAFSYWNGTRFRNMANIHRYARALHEGILPCDFEETLAPDAARRELLIIALRLRDGVDLDAFQAAHGPLEQEVLNTLQHHCSLGLLEKTGARIRLTRDGVFVYDSLASELV